MLLLSYLVGLLLLGQHHQVLLQRLDDVAGTLVGLPEQRHLVAGQIAPGRPLTVCLAPFRKDPGGGSQKDQLN